MKFTQIVATILVLFFAVWAVTWLSNGGVPDKLVTDLTPDSSIEKPDTDETDEEKDFYLENPFNLSTKGPHPKASMENSEYEFEKMVLGSTGEHTFIIRNSGDVPLKLAKGRSQCKCTVSGLKEQEIAPGEEAGVTLAWTPKATGPFRQGATIWTNDPEHPELTINVQGMMEQAIFREPEGSWVLGNITPTEDTEFKGTIYSKLIDDFKITDLENEAEGMKVEYIPLSEEELQARDAVSGFHIKGVLKAKDEQGTVDERFVIKTNLPDAESFIYSVSAYRPGPMTILGKKWQAQTETVNLGSVHASEGVKHQLVMLVRSDGEPLEVTDIVTDPPFLKVEIVSESGPAKKGERERLNILIEIPAGSRKGGWPAQKPATVKFKTNHPKLPEVEFKVGFVTM